MQPAFEVAKDHGDCLDALFVGEVLQPLFADSFRRDVAFALVLCRQVAILQFGIGNLNEIAQGV
jgi:hypothetical protein